MSTPRLLILYIVCRLVALLTLALPDGDYIPSDLGLFARWAESLGTGHAIEGDRWQYPPGVALLLGAIGRVGGGSATIMVLICAADIAVLFILGRSRGALLWAVAPLFVGPMMLTRLETLVTLTAILGLTARSAGTSGVWLGLGASLKLWPGVLTLVDHRGAARRIFASLAVFGAVAIVAHLLFEVPSFLGNQAQRGLQVESLAAWPFLVARAFGAPVELISRNGSVEIDSTLADGIAAVLLPISMLVAGALATWGGRRRPDSIHSRASVSLVVVLALLLTSRVLSPQFIVWAIGLLALALREAPMPPRLARWLLGSALLGQVLYPFAYVDFLEGGVLGLSIQTGRLALLVGAGWWAFHESRAIRKALVALPQARSPETRPA